jgi:hypothetical protein
MKSNRFPWLPVYLYFFNGEGIMCVLSVYFMTFAPAAAQSDGMNSRSGHAISFHGSLSRRAIWQE